MTLINKEFIDKTVLQLHKQNYSAAQVGLYLRNNYFIKTCTKLTRLYPFLEDAEIDHKKAQIRAEKLKAHTNKYKKDYKAQRALLKKDAEIYHKGLYAKKRTLKKKSHDITLQKN